MYKGKYTNGKFHCVLISNHYVRPTSAGSHEAHIKCSKLTACDKTCISVCHLSKSFTPTPRVSVVEIAISV